MYVTWCLNSLNWNLLTKWSRRSTLRSSQMFEQMFELPHTRISPIHTVTTLQGVEHTLTCKLQGMALNHWTSNHWRAAPNHNNVTKNKRDISWHYHMHRITHSLSLQCKNISMSAFSWLRLSSWKKYCLLQKTVQTLLSWPEKDSPGGLWFANIMLVSAFSTSIQDRCVFMCPFLLVYVTTNMFLNAAS